MATLVASSRRGAAACGVAAGDIALDVLRKYRDFVTRVVCCYSTETESECGDYSLHEQELVELLPADGRSNGGRAALRGRAPGGGCELRTGEASARGGDDDDDYRDTSSEDESDATFDGAMMRPAAAPRRAEGDDSASPAQRIVQRLQERPQRRSRALALALSDASSSPGGDDAAAQTAAQSAALHGGDAPALLVPLYAPGTSD